MRYYIIHNKKKIYFPYSLEGFRQIQLYAKEHNLTLLKGEIHTDERSPESKNEE